MIAGREKQVAVVRYVEITSEVSVLFILGDISSMIKAFRLFDLAVDRSARMRVVEIKMIGIRSCLLYLSNYLYLYLYMKPNDVHIYTSPHLPNCVSIISFHCTS